MSKTVRRASTRIITGAIASFALAAGAVLAAAPAHAAPGDCRLGYGCLYSGYSYGNDWLQSFNTQRFGNCIDDLTKHWYNDIASSFFNNGRRDAVYVYEDIHAEGPRKRFLKNSGLSNLGGWNDRISSVYFETQLKFEGTAQCL